MNTVRRLMKILLEVMHVWAYHEGYCSYFMYWCVCYHVSWYIHTSVHRRQGAVRHFVMFLRCSMCIVAFIENTSCSVLLVILPDLT